MQDTLVIHADFGNAAHHVAFIAKSCIDVGNILADNRCIEDRARRNSNQFFQFIHRDAFIAYNIYAVNRRIHLYGIVQLDAFRHISKCRFYRRKQARRTNNIQVMADVVGIDGIAYTHSQAGHKLGFNRFVRHRAYRDR